MSEAVHWKKLTNPLYLGECDFEGTDIVGTIQETKQQEVIGDKGKKDICTVMHFFEDLKPLILNKTNAKTISSLFKSKLLSGWDGGRIQMYFDHTVKFGKDTVGGIRVRNYHPESTKLICHDCNSEIKDSEKDSKIKAKQISDYSLRTYGVSLCSGCANKRHTEKNKKEREIDAL